MGMIITASFNFLWNGKQINSEVDTKQVVMEAGLEKSIENMKKDLELKKESQDDGMQQEKMVENNKVQEETEKAKEDDITQEEPSTVWITIKAGMNTNNIAKLLYKEGLISNTAEFVDLAYAKNYTRKFIAGKKAVPTNSSLEELLQILTER